MKFASLKNTNDVVNFETSLNKGLAADGGLYMSQTIPAFSVRERASLASASFPEVAFATMAKWLGDEIPVSDLRSIISHAFNFDIPIVHVGPMEVMELFHGPTFAFKDVAAQFLASCIEHYVKKRHEPTNIVVATSGDTGGAIAHAFNGLSGIKVFVLYPKDRVSKIQQQQLTKGGSNIEAIEIDGSFDDCQVLVKRALSDDTLGINLSSANSINIGRLLPQITYYAYAASQLGEYEAIIPTGNLGNATAALMAHKMRLGPTHLTLASNSNDAIVRYYESGSYNPSASIQTLSSAMDVGDPNNLPRFMALLNEDVSKFRKLADVFSVSDGETVETLKRVHENYGYLLDPHTAVAWRAAELSKSRLPKLVISTASPMKFASEIKKVAGINVDTTPIITSLNKTASRSTRIPSDYKSFRELLKSHAIV